MLLYNREISECVCHSPKFEPNQNGHKSVNFKARTSRFGMLVDLKEEETKVEEENDNDNNYNIFSFEFFCKVKNDERSKAKEAERS